MKALTVYQPWASLIAWVVKPYEFRGFDYSTRNGQIQGARVAIHASARPVKYREIVDLCDRLEAGQRQKRPTTGGTGLLAGAVPILQEIRAGMEGKGPEKVLPLSSIVCTATVGKAVKASGLFQGEPTNDSDRDEHALWAWPMLAVKACAPIPCKGLQGFWNVPIDIERQLHYGR